MVIRIHPSILTDITCPDTCETTVLKVRLLYMHLYHKPIPVLTCTPAPVNPYTHMYPCTLNRYFNLYSIKAYIEHSSWQWACEKIWPVDQAHAYCIRRGYTNQGSGWDWASCQQYHVAGMYCACVATLINALFIP